MHLDTETALRISEIQALNPLLLERFGNPSTYRIMGVYFLFKDGIIVYIGKSVNLISRVCEHFRSVIKDFDEYTYIQCSHEELDYFERIFINKHKPKYNNDSLTKYMQNDL